MRRIFELNGRRVESETRQCDVNCWELRITDAEGNVTIQHFSNPRLLDKTASRTHRDLQDQGWMVEPMEKWVPTARSFAK
jgi:hypothetical protein